MFLYQLIEKVGTRMNKGFSRSCINFLFETHAIVLATQFNNFVAIYFRGVARNFQRGVTEATHCCSPSCISRLSRIIAA